MKIMMRILLSVFLSFFILAAEAQDMASLFINMPNQHTAHLESAWRKDLVELYNLGEEARVQNMMNGTSVLKKLTPDYLLLQKTGRSTLEMKLLPLVNNTYVLCVIKTVNGPVSDSKVEFYTTEWEPLDATDLYTPASTDWFFKNDIDKTSEDYLFAVSRLDMELIHYQLDADREVMTATYTTPQYLGQEERGRITPLLKESPKVFKWEKYRFN